MAVPVQTPYIEYTANGATTSFSLGFYCELKEHLIVTIDDVEPLLADWSLVGGNVVFTVAPLSGKVIKIRRNTPFSRSTDYQSYDNSFRAPSVNKDFDSVWYKIQELGVTDWMLANKIQKFRDDVNLTALDNTLIQAQDIRDDTAILASEVQSNTTQSQTLLANTTTQANLAQGYADSANTANAAAQQAVIDVSTAEADVYSALSAQQIAVNNSLTAIAGGHKAYQTLALAQAAQASLPANTIVEVTNDGANNGTYQWDGTTLTKSAYDPLTQAKTYTDTAETNAKSYTDEKAILDPTDTENLHVLKDSAGETVAAIGKDGKVRFIGLPLDLVAYLQELDPSNRIVLDSSSSKLISLLDANGLEVLYQDKSGDIFIPKVGNLTQLLLKSSQSPIDELHGAHKAGEYVDALRVETMPNVFNTGFLLKGLDVGATNIFTHTVNQLREPGLTRIGKYKYLVFFDAKGEQGDFGVMSQGVATVTINPTTMLPTTSNIQSLADAFTDVDGKLKVFFGGVGVKTNSGKVICLYMRRFETTEHKLYMRTSDDDGVTWNAQVDLTDMVRGTTGWNLLCPTSKGIVKRFGKHKGRIIIPFYTVGTAYVLSQSKVGYIYSDDDGVTWKLGEFIGTVYGASELCIAEYLNGDMLFVVRTDLFINKKAIFRHSDVTKQFNQLAFGEVFTDVAIMSGVIQGDNIYDGTASKFMFTTCRDSNRYDLQVHTSYDGGETWQTKLVAGTAGVPVAYTSIESIDANNLLLVWESGFANDFSYHTISLNNLIEV